MRRLLLLLALCLALPALAQHDDHPLLTRYEGSEVREKTVQEFAEYRLATAVDAKKGEIAGDTLQGRLTRFVYMNPAERSTLEIMANYRQALAKAGLVPVFSCELDGCGPSWGRSSWGRFNGLSNASDGDPRYLAGRIVKGDATAYVAVMVGKRRTRVDILEVVGMQQDKVVADAAALGQGLDADGRIAVYGILFDTDQAVVKPESKPALDEIAKLLKARPALKLYVVGHTDGQGALAHNRDLSERRARAVVQALVQQHGIAAARLDGHGVGPLAPVAENTSEAGRAKNRRVELVAR